jgi:hypothetical protein
MELLRLAPFPLTYTVEELEAGTDYSIAILDDHAEDLVEIPVTADGDGVVSTPLPNYFSRYDQTYRVEIYVKTGENTDGSAIRGDLVYVDTLSIVRPYTDPSLYADTEDELEQAKMYEVIARGLIDAYIADGFYYSREVIDTVGMDNDYLALPYRLNKLIRVYENDYLVYDSEPTDSEWTNLRGYMITADKSAITVVIDDVYGGYNRMQSKPVVPRTSASDSFTLYNTNDSPNIIQNIAGSPMFPQGRDYIVVVDAGWPVVPEDIKVAAKLLINDLKCNTSPHLNSYVKQYESDQFNIEFQPDAYSGTGNRVVDKILSNYTQHFHRIGVL